MKRSRINLFNLLFFVLLAFAGANAQNYISENANTLGFSTSLNNGAMNNLLNSQNQATANASDNIIFVNQIGDRNAVEVANQIGSSSTLDIAQTGNDNLVYLSVQARTLIQNILQDGDGHEVLNFSSNPNVQDLEIVQRGSDQNLIFHGTNSISEKMKINMEGNSQSIIVRSFN
ncbi:MAG: hypothetical protein CMC35_08575 [Flavobacteriaceae bacterium]|nr:hypothetical protein [Flavobacteriaceae bacterium]|tara:strand:- start:19901 stop:20422 length:522 start_codon:yes stop_codon:yes gene_type:complete